MLTYTPKSTQISESKREYPWLLMLLVFAWLWPGVFSHDLWNPQEPQIYAAIMENHTPFLPTLLGEPYFQVAPVYVWLAAWTRYLLSPWLTDAYSATRFATVIFMALGLTAHGMAAYRFLGASHGRSTVLILIGSAGLLNLGHFLGTLSVAFAGLGLAWWGLAVAQRQAVMAATFLGVGVLLIGQSMGWLFSGCLILTALFISITPQWRSVRYFTVLLGALAIIVPLMILQMIVLFKLNAVAFHDYWQHHVFGAFGGLAGVDMGLNGWYYLRNMLWFAFPAYPLAIWTVYKMGGQLLQTRWGVLCVVWLLVFGAVLVANPQRYQDNLLLVLPPLAVMGAAQLDYLRRGVAAFLNWFGVMAFGLVSVFLWVGFVAMNYGFPAKLAERAAYFSPFYTRDIDIMPMVVAILFTPAWIFAITRKRIRGRQAVSNWASGMTLAWALLLTLFLPWLDAAKSYRPIVQQMEQAVPDVAAASCLYIAPEHATARLAWGEYGSVKVVSDESGKGCSYQLVQFHQQAQVDALNGKGVLWKGKRPRQKQEFFVLMKRWG